MAHFDDVNLNSRRWLTMWRGSACSLVLFSLVLVITGLVEMGILPVWEQTVRKMLMVVMKVT